MPVNRPASRQLSPEPSTDHDDDVSVGMNVGFQSRLTSPPAILARKSPAKSRQWTATGAATYFADGIVTPTRAAEAMAPSIFQASGPYSGSVYTPTRGTPGTAAFCSPMMFKPCDSLLPGTSGGLTAMDLALQRTPGRRTKANGTPFSPGMFLSPSQFMLLSPGGYMLGDMGSGQPYMSPLAADAGFTAPAAVTGSAMMMPQQPQRDSGALSSVMMQPLVAPEVSDAAVSAVLPVAGVW